MAGEIAAAYIALLPTMRSFGSEIVAQGGPQIRAASQKLGAQSGEALGAALGGSASKAALPAISSINDAVRGAKAGSESWFAADAQMAIKNVALYGSMYQAIQVARQGIDAMFSSMVGFNSELQQAQIGFTQILGSSMAAKGELAWVKDFARETPFNFQDVLQYDQQLQAMIGDSKEAHDALQAAGDAAAGLGRGAEGVHAITLALGQMATKGKIQSQELVLQLSQVGINGVKILADQLGTTTADIQDRMQQGILDSATFLPVLIKGIEQKYAGLMQKDSQTLAGLWSNIQDTLQQQLAAAGKPLFDELTSEAKQGLSALSSPEVEHALMQFGQLTAGGAKDLVELVKWAYNGRDAFIALAAVLAARGLWNSERIQSFVTNVKSIGPALNTATQASKAATEAQAYYDAVLTGSQASTAKANAALIERASAQAALAGADRQLAEAQAVFDAAGVKEIATDARVEAATTARALAVERLQAAESGVVAANLDAALSSKQLAAADEASAAAATASAQAQAAKSKVLGGLKGLLGGVGQIAGLAAAADGLNRVTTSANDTTKASLGVAEALGGGALAGAAFGLALGPEGAAAGAAVGAIVGLTTSLVELQQAQEAANKDTSATADALTKVGVSAAVAKTAVSYFNNAQLKSLGGSQQFVDAIQQGGTKLDALIEKLHQAELLQQVYAELPAAQQSFVGGSDSLEGVKHLAAATEALRNAATDAAYSQFLAVEASNAATGSYGAQAKQAYATAFALGQISGPLEQTGIAAEGASGMVGYLLNSLTGLPVNTPINFSTNATDILQKIFALQQAIAAISPKDQHADNRAYYDNKQLAALEAQLKSALTTPVSAAVTGAAKKAGGGAANAALAAAQAAAEAAAQKLKQDQQAQLQFSDAFGSLMKNALEGDFDQYRDQLQSQITSLTRDGYTAAAAALKKLSPTLTQAALDYAALTNKVKAADDAEASLTGKMKEQYQSTVDLITGLGKVSDAQSFDQLTYLLSSTTSAAVQYQDTLTKLKNEGLSQDIWNQLAQAGPQSAALAQSILAQGQAGVDELNSLSGSLVDAADSMGSLVSQSMYQQGVDAMKAYIDGLNSQSAALEAQLVTIANNILSQTAGAITPGNAGYSPIAGGTTTIANTYSTIVNLNADDLKSVQAFIAMLNSAPTTQLVNAAGQVTS